VELTAHLEGDGVVVEVADDGPGIPTSVREALFQEGARGPESAGTGLGLYLVHTLVTRYGGTVSAHDNQPRGTVVRVELPRGEDPASEA
jgi:signal transduction histidine kinase